MEHRLLLRPAPVCLIKEHQLHQWLVRGRNSSGPEGKNLKVTMTGDSLVTVRPIIGSTIMIEPRLILEMGASLKGLSSAPLIARPQLSIELGLLRRVSTPLSSFLSPFQGIFCFSSSCIVFPFFLPKFHGSMYLKITD